MRSACFRHPRSARRSLIAGIDSSTSGVATLSRISWKRWPKACPVTPVESSACQPAAGPVHLLQLVGDIGEQLECQFSIQEGIADLHSRERGFLIRLDEVMVGILGVGQRAQVKRVDGG